MIFNEEIISSRNNPIVKWASSLSLKKGHRDAESFIAEGEKLTLEALKSELPVTHILVMESKRERVLELLSSYTGCSIFDNCRVIVLSDAAFEKISTEKAPQGVISVIKYLDFFRNMDIIYKEEFFISEGERALALYSLRDPGNLGAVIRSAVAFGVEHIVLSSDSADIYSPKTVRAAMGSLFKVKITVVGDMTSFIESAKANGRRIFAAELSENAKSVKEISLCANDIFMIGNEGHGIPSEISSICTGSVYIPISDKTESLNASVAAAIFMWEQSK